MVVAVVAQVNARSIEPESPLGVSIVKSGTLVKVFYRAEESGNVKVTIFNDKGVVVFKETLPNTDDFMRPYNFSALPKGVYIIRLTDKNGAVERKVEHNLDRKIMAKFTRLNPKEHKYMLSVPKGKSNSFTVRVLDSRGRILLEETHAANGDFAKVYNLNNIGGGHTIELTDGKGRRNVFSQPLY